MRAPWQPPKFNFSSKISQCRKCRTVPKNPTAPKNTPFTILKHCRSYSLSLYFDETIANLGSIHRDKSIEKTQDESSANQNRTRKTQDESSNNQNRTNISPVLVRGWKTFLGSRLAIAYVKTWRVFHPPPDQILLLLLT